VLRAPCEGDIPAWFARATDAEAAALAGDPVAVDITDGERWLARSHQRFIDGTAIKWSIDREGEAIGSITLTFEEADAQAAALGFVLARAHWGQGLVTEAAREVVRYGFEALPLERVTAEAAMRNFASLRVLEKLGFTEVASFVDPSDGENCKRFTLEKDMRSPPDRGS